MSSIVWARFLGCTYLLMAQTMHLVLFGPDFAYSPSTCLPVAYFEKKKKFVLKKNYLGPKQLRPVL
jgi:hypothetical protein